MVKSEDSLTLTCSGVPSGAGCWKAYITPGIGIGMTQILNIWYLHYDPNCLYIGITGV